MALPSAKALAGDLLVLPYSEEVIARAALVVTTALLAASPRVAWEGGRADGRTRGLNNGVWWVDAGGLGDEQKLAHKLLRIAKARGFGPARVGVADAAMAAYAATFRHPSARPPVRLTALVPSGRDAAFLAAFPLSLLEPDDDLADTLRALGLTTVGQLAALTTDEVEARFGPPGLVAHRLARGLDTRGPSTPRDDALPAFEADLGGPVATAEPLGFVLKGMLDALGDALRDRGLAAREVAVVLSLDDGSRAERAVRPARPTSHAAALFDHCRAALDDWPLPEPVVAIAVRAAVTVPAAGEQGSLLAVRWADPAALEAAFDRIRGREGSGAIAVPEARDGHLPEDAGHWGTGAPGHRDAASARRPSGRASGRAGASAHGGAMPARSSAEAYKGAVPTPPALRLLAAPEPIRVRLGRAGLSAFRHGDTWRDIAAWDGPERLAPRWWTTDDGPRDYYTARTRDGTCWLLFRRAKAWCLAGWWD